ncbi:MAG: prepilin-type N-terminal cleavage/methylation domain-containing protein [Thermoanaerobaculia bacterium]|nr:prepilin-type N-terminal cleavage/methylation domain-containing protein [Thermoanaerobaculia bacterium]
MLNRNRETGFTLIELLIVVAIIGILASMLIPNLLDALQKAKQKRSMADARIVGTAMMSWLSDRSQAMAAGAALDDVDMANYPVITVEDLEAQLVPQYLQDVPERDGWKQVFDFRLDLDEVDGSIMAARSRGADNAYSTDVYSPSSFDPTDYAQDIVWIDGFFIRWPQKTN